MKYPLVIFITIFLLCSCSHRTQLIIAPEVQKGLDALAVLPTEFKDKADSILDLDLSSVITKELMTQGLFTLVDRKFIDKIINEMLLFVSGLIGTDNTLKLGKLLGAKYMLVTTVETKSLNRKKNSIGIMWVEKARATVEISAKIIDVQKGLVVASAHEEAYIEESQWVAFFFAKLGGFSSEEEMIRSAAQIAATNAVRKMLGRF